MRDYELDALAAMAENWHPNFAERQGIKPRRRIETSRPASAAGGVARSTAYPTAKAESRENAQPVS